MQRQNLREKSGNLTPRKWESQTLERKLMRQKSLTTSDGTITSEVNPLKTVKEQLGYNELYIKSLLESEESFWKRGFAKRFFERLILMTPKTTGYNEKLYSFAQNMLDEERRLELEVFEKAVSKLAAVGLSRP
jgi:hypothetical protein